MSQFNFITFPTWCRIATAVAIALVLQLSFTGAKAASEDVITIGVFVPLTGALAPLGTDMRNGYELAVEHHPKVKGKQVELVVADSQGNAAAGRTKAQKMVLADKAKVLIGGASSSVVLAINAQARRLNVPIVTTNSQAVQTTGDQCSRYLFRTNPNDAMVANATALMMQQRPELLEKEWFVVFHDNVWGQSNKSEFEEIPGVKIAGEASVAVGTADWAPVISAIKASGADAIYLALLVGNDMPAFIRQARSFGLEHVMLPPIGMPDAMLQTLSEEGVGLITGGLFGSWMLENRNEKMARFVEDYYETYGIVPGPQAIQAYAGMRLTLAALDAADSLKTDDIIKALEEVSIDTIIGGLSIREGDHQGKVGTYFAKSIKLPEPKYDAKVAWKVIKKFSWDAIKVDLAKTGCTTLADAE